MNEKEFNEKLSNERQEIDRIDSQLLPLFVQRMKCSQRVAAIKREAGAPVLNAQREREILDRVSQRACQLGGSPDFGHSAAALYQAMLAISRASQHCLLEQDSPLAQLERTAKDALPNPIGRVVCQGVDGAYSHKAARCLFPGAEIQFVPEFKEVFSAVDSGALGVLPVENSAAGSVTAVYDLILKYRFYIVGAVDISIEHCLCAPEGTARQEITHVLSHPQALSQCSEFIFGSGLIPKEYSNTAAAAEYLSKQRPKATAAICSLEAAERYGLQVLQRGVQNEKNNTTRFIAISKEAVLPKDANKISLCFSLPHTTGSLYNVLQQFAAVGLSLTKIESRPIPGSTFEYDFYLDFTGSIHNKETLALICALNAELPRFSFLGNYSEIRSLSISSLLLRRIETPEEISAMCQVAKKVWHMTYDRLLPSGQVDYMIDRFQSPPAVSRQIAQEGYMYYGLYQGSELGGFVGFVPGHQGKNQVYLSKIYILPQLRGQGGMREILRLVESEARSRGIPEILLTVNKENTHAIKVYKHYGFKTVDAVETDIGGGYIMDDYIMVKKL